jgi:nucleoside-diphosphate-sugar epimerase
MQALVTGGGGFLGRYIVEQLRARGDSVRVLARGEYPELVALGCELLRGDIQDGDTVLRACAGCDTVFHVAAVAGIWGPASRYFPINTQATDHVIAACRQQGVKRLVYTSSPSVVYDGTDQRGADESLPYPKSFLCHYPQSKALAEQAVLAAHGVAGVATCSLRPHLIWGPRDNHLIPRLVARARSGRLRRVGTWTNRISMVYVENAAAAHLQAADRLSVDSPVGGQAYFINEREPVAMWPWIDELLAVAGVGPVKKAMSLRSAYAIGAALEGVYKVLGLTSEPPMTRFLALQLATDHWYSVAKAERDFGYRPVVSLEEAMRRVGPELRALGRGEGRMAHAT